MYAHMPHQRSFLLEYLFTQNALQWQHISMQLIVLIECCFLFQVKSTNCTFELRVFFVLLQMALKQKLHWNFRIWSEFFERQSSNSHRIVLWYLKLLSTMSICTRLTTGNWILGWSNRVVDACVELGQPH